MTPSPGKRTMKNSLSTADSKVEQFLSKFSELRSALQERAIVQTEIVVFRVLETVENISLYFLLHCGCLSERERRCGSHTR
jgi:hypothetical protein